MSNTPSRAVKEKLFVKNPVPIEVRGFLDISMFSGHFLPVIPGYPVSFFDTYLGMVSFDPVSLSDRN
jgi:hypothetical protein